MSTFAGTARFQVLSRLGEGGDGVVYAVLDRERQCPVALKTLRTSDPAAIRRLKREFRSLQELRHPNLVSLGELFEDGGRWFFTMELVRGTSLLRYVRPHDQRWRRSASTLDDDADTAELASVATARPGGDEGRLRATLAQTATGLLALHRAHKVHRDIKPGNILVDDHGRVVILDYGLVLGLHDRNHDDRLAGTVAYMAPEQALEARVGPAADWYALGVVLYAALTGTLPFTGSPAEVIAKKRSSAPCPPRLIAPETPADLEALCLALLSPDPLRRPHGPEVLRMLGVTTVDPVDGGSLRPPFVGREPELATLGQAFADSCAGATVTVLVAGESGLGKSALVRSFLDRLVAEEPATVVLAGRCHERESVPFKTLDEIVDALAAHLAELSPDDCAQLLPARSQLLATVFPSLRPVVAIANLDKAGPEPMDAREQRAHLFAAFRELIGNLAQRGPVVLAIDDLQWADADGLAMLAELIRSPHAPALLVVGTVRLQSRDDTADPAPAVLRERARVIRLQPLPDDITCALAELLLGGVARASELAPVIAEEASGHPLFLAELVRRARRLGRADERLRLDDVLWERVGALEAPARQLIELCAIADAPLSYQMLASASGVELNDLADAAAELRGADLVRTTGTGAADTVALYHDRVRHAVVDRLAPEVLTQRHERLALAHEIAGAADHEALVIHWRGAENPEAAGLYAAIAGREAAAALAFDRAATRFRLALELAPPSGDDGRVLRVQLGDALANAGRGREAGATYLAAAEGAPPELALDLKRRAADQLLRAGHIDDGLAVVDDLLRAVGLTMPATPRRALASLLWLRARIRLRGLGFTRRTTEQLEPGTLRRIDLCWTIGALLGLVDTIRGAAFQSRHLLLALEAGEPARIARALAAETAFTSAAGGSSRRRTAQLSAAAATLSEEVGTPYAIGWSTATAGFAAALESRWPAARQLCERADQILRDGCTGVAWEIDSLRFFTLWSLANLGELSTLAERVPVHLRDAEERGDLYAASYLRTGLSNLIWLADDDPARARDLVRDAARQWSQRGFHVEHWWNLLATGHIELYAGRGAEAHRSVTEAWPALAGSLLLRVQLTRIEALCLRARSALAAAGQGARAAELRRDATRAAARIAREDAPGARPRAELVYAGVAVADRDLDLAARLLDHAATGFDAAAMAMHAAVARARRGALLGGDSGRELAAPALAWMTAQGVRDHERYMDMIAPGFR